MRPKRRITSLERNKQKRYDFVTNRRFRLNDKWSDCSLDYIQDMSEDEYEFSELSQNDIIQVFVHTKPFSQNEPIFRNAIQNTLQIIESVDNDFDEFNQIDDRFFTVEVLNKLCSVIGSDQLPKSLQINILKTFKELIHLKDLSDVSIANIVSSELSQTLVHMIEFANEELVEQSVDVIEELKNKSNVLIFKIINCGYINAIHNRVKNSKHKTLPNIWSKDLTVQQKLLGFKSCPIDENYNKRVSNSCHKLLRVLSRAVLQLFDTEFNRMNEFVECMTPLILQFITSSDVLVKNNAFNALLMFDESNKYINHLIFENFIPLTLNAMQNMNDSVLLQAIHLLNKVISSDRLIIKDQRFLIQVFKCVNELLIRNRSDKVIKDVIHCVSTVAELLPINYRFSFEFLKETQILIAFLMNLKINVNACYVIHKILDRYSLIELEFIYRTFNIMEAINKMLDTNDINCQIFGLKIISHIFKTISNSDNISLKVSLMKCFYETDIEFLLNRLSNSNNSEVSKSAQYFLKMHIDYNPIPNEDITLLPISEVNQYIFGLQLKFFNFKF